MCRLTFFFNRRKAPQFYHVQFIAREQHVNTTVSNERLNIDYQPTRVKHILQKNEKINHHHYLTYTASPVELLELLEVSAVSGLSVDPCSSLSGIITLLK